MTFACVMPGCGRSGPVVVRVPLHCSEVTLHYCTGHADAVIATDPARWKATPKPLTCGCPGVAPVAQAIPPAFTRYLGEQLMAEVLARREAAA